MKKEKTYIYRLLVLLIGIPFRMLIFVENSILLALYIWPTRIVRGYGKPILTPRSAIEIVKKECESERFDVDDIVFRHGLREYYVTVINEKYYMGGARFIVDCYSGKCTNPLNSDKGAKDRDPKNGPI